MSILKAFLTPYRAGAEDIEQVLNENRYSRRVSIAPMMDWTDHFFRYFIRLISTHAWLYTEMVHTDALIHGNRERLLKFTTCEHPLALQLGGSDPSALAQCAGWAEAYGFDEVNLNVGCPSARVQAGAFGACLMATPYVVADALKAMQDRVAIPVTIKHRLGLDAQSDYETLQRFVEIVARHSNTRVFIVHARNALLKGLSPKENRSIPPLNYRYVYRLKIDFPELCFILNGGIGSVVDVAEHLNYVDGVMIGRAACYDPYLLVEVDRHFYSDPHPLPSRRDVLFGLLPVITSALSEGVPLSRMTSKLMGLTYRQSGAREWRRFLSNLGSLPENDPRFLIEALERVEAYEKS